MRSPFWCSALALVALAGCGGTAKLDVHEQLVSQSPRVRLERVTFDGIHGYLALSRRPGRHPGVLWLHGSGGSDRDFLLSAAKWANRGGVGLTISQPNNADSFAPLVRNARRALDLLAAREDVDPRRLGIAGLSLGAETAAIVAGEDARVRAVALESGRGRPEVDLAVAKSKADFYVQAGLRDQVIPRPELRSLIGSIRGRVVVRWYDLSHVLDQRAYDDQLAWLRAELHPGR